MVKLIIAGLISLVGFIATMILLAQLWAAIFLTHPHPDVIRIF